MTAYIIRRLLLMIPTLLGIMTINFFVIQAAPGGPVDQLIAKLQAADTSVLQRVAGSTQGETVGTGGGGQGENSGQPSRYRGAQGLDPKLIQQIEKMYGFDQPIWVRYFRMLGRYARFDFGDSFFRDRSVIRLILDKMPVSISLGVSSTLIIYLVSIPLGIRKAMRHGTRFDIWTSTLIIVGNAVPVFLFAIILIVFLAGGSYLDWFPLRGLTSADFSSLSLLGKAADFLWHLTLPVLALVIGGFATLTMLTKNSFLDEIHKQYVVTARAKGLTEGRILYGHVFRNAMLIVISGFPAALVGMFFTGSLLIEVIFSLDGLGLLGFESTLQRDYPVMFGTLYIFTFLGLLVKLVSDMTYTLVDPRIDFETRES